MPGKKPTYTGRDLHRCVGQAHDAHFNPRAPYGARRPETDGLHGHGPISIHAPHMGRDQTPHMDGKPSVVFQSTRPIRGATCYGETPSAAVNISIHAPHTGRDSPVRSHRSLTLFQSTRPIRGATYLLPPTYLMVVISIHAPHTGRDDKSKSSGGQINISIHAPHTGRDCCSNGWWWRSPISIHAPHTGRDGRTRHTAHNNKNFNPRAPYGARLCSLAWLRLLLDFNPRAPYGARR